ncbi:acyl-CoA thioesterase [Geomonas propionica]|uniref:Acyl-CoA thioesterase n=1 Tax=Geomonas propionica TaxID=2798582 RepID=A0ABS0YZ05_9BACT|nr:acyl-CoA thioesterase [Geomonas propionica]MBJ6802730.1 acyl-CoA thioesterase [Geomonas propionica]
MTTPSETSFIHTLSLADDLSLRRRFMVMDEDLLGNLRFGLLLEILDKVAEETALRYVNRFYPDARVVTAAIDNIIVRHVADVTRDIVCEARINQVGRSSLVIGIRVEQPGNPANHVASCYFTMVARSGMGEGAVSVALPPLDYATEREQARARKAVARREEYRQQQALMSEPPSLDEYRMLAALHKAQDEPGFQGLLAGQLSADSWERMYPEFENVPQKIFGGYLVRKAYELSSICSELVAPDRSVMAAVNRINFFHPVRMGDKLHYTSRVVFTCDSYVCVEANIERISRDRTSKALSNSCLFTFVNVDRELVHRPVPAVYPTTYAEDARYLEAERSFAALSEHLT